MTAFTLRARWVLPVDGPPIDGGYVGVADGRIVAVGRRDPGAGMIEDLGDVALLPGLVNAHTHLEFSDLAKPLGSPGMPLPEWIRLVIADRRRGNRDPAAAIAAGLRESAAAGASTVAEIATSPAAFYSPNESRPTTLLLHEAIGFSAGRVDSVFADLKQRLNASTPDAGLSPHAPYTVHPRMLERVVELASSRNSTVAMHLAESREELQLLAAGDGPFRDLLIERSMWDETAIPRGSSPLDYLRTLAAAPRALVIHGNYLQIDEIDFLSNRRNTMSVVYCPRTHAYFEHTRYPLAEMLASGVRVALGTDSRASNPDLSLLAELRYMAATQPSVSADLLLRMATLNGAEALGMAASVGSLTPGKFADMMALPCQRDPYESVLLGRGGPSRTWLRGNDIAATWPA